MMVVTTFFRHVTMFNILILFATTSLMYLVYWSNTFTEVNERECLLLKSRSDLTLIDMIETLPQLKMEMHCKNLHDTIDGIFSFKLQETQLALTEHLYYKMASWLGNDLQLLRQAEKQKIITVRNKWSHEYNICNPLRDLRPIPYQHDQTDYLEQITRKSAENCDFCNYKNETGVDSFGRLESVYCYMAVNLFKLDVYNAMVVLKTHEPLKWNQEQFVDMFEMAEKWFHKVHSLSSFYIYPHILWDMLPKAGGSQIHPHFHTFLTNDQYYGEFHRLLTITHQYNLLHPDSTYINDLIYIHTALGLSVKLGSATAYVSLVPRKDNEIVITSSTPGRDLYRLTYCVLRAFIDDMHKFAFSFAMAWPPLSSRISGLPALIRVVTRGSSVSELRSDITSLELFTMSNVNSDPYRTIQMIRQSVNLRCR